MWCCLFVTILFGFGRFRHDKQLWNLGDVGKFKWELWTVASILDDTSPFPDVGWRFYAIHRYPKGVINNRFDWGTVPRFIGESLPQAFGKGRQISIPLGSRAGAEVGIPSGVLS